MEKPKLPQPEAVLFDAYGTLFDVYSVGLLAEQLFAGKGEALALLWRDKQIDYTRLASMSGRYRPFWDLTRAGLQFAALKLGLTLDPVLSADAVKRFKTDPAVYQLGPDALGLPARKILFVSSNGWDAIGATWFGYTTLWVNRAGAPLEQLATDPTRTASNLRAVLDFFPAVRPQPV